MASRLSAGTRHPRTRIVGPVRIQPALHRPSRKAESQLAGGPLDGLEIQPVGGARPYERFDFGVDLGREPFLEAPFFAAASAAPPRPAASCVWHSASLTSINSPVSRRKR